MCVFGVEQLVFQSVAYIRRCGTHFVHFPFFFLSLSLHPQPFLLFTVDYPQDDSRWFEPFHEAFLSVSVSLSLFTRPLTFYFGFYPSFLSSRRAHSCVRSLSNDFWMLPSLLSRLMIVSFAPFSLFFLGANVCPLSTRLKDRPGGNCTQPLNDR